MDSAALKHSTIASIAWKLFEKGGRAAVELAVQVVMARLLAPAQFGALAVMLVFVNTGNVIVQSGLNTALVQTPDMDDVDCSTVFWMSLALALAMYAALFVCAPAIEGYAAAGKIAWPMRVLGLVFLLNALNSVQIAIVQRNLQLHKVFRATILAVLVSGAVGVALAVLAAGLWALVVQQLCYALVNCAAMAAQVAWRPRAAFDVHRARELRSFGWKILAAALLEQLYQGVSDLIVGKKYTPAALGFVSQGKKYPQALGTVLDGAIQPVMLSAVSRVQGDAAMVKRLARRALKTSTYLIFPMMTLVGTAADPLVRLLLGEQWVPCVPFFQLYCFIYALLPIHSTNLQVINGVGRSDLFLMFEIIRKSYAFALLAIAAMCFAEPIWLVGCYALANVISTFVNMWPVRRLVGYTCREQFSDMAPAAGLALVSGALAVMAARAAAVPAGAAVLLQAAVMAAAYVGISALVRVEAYAYLRDTVLGGLRRR